MGPWRSGPRPRSPRRYFSRRRRFDSDSGTGAGGVDGFALALMRGKRRAGAEGGGPAEGDVAVVLAGDVETVGIGEGLRIGVGRPHHRDHRLPLPDPAPAQVEILGRDAGGVLARALVTQQLLDRG